MTADERRLLAFLRKREADLVPRDWELCRLLVWDQARLDAAADGLKDAGLANRMYAPYGKLVYLTLGGRA